MTSMVPVKVRKQGETVWIKLMSYFRLHVGAQRKGTGCVVTKKKQTGMLISVSDARRLRVKNRRWRDL